MHGRKKMWRTIFIFQLHNQTTSCSPWEGTEGTTVFKHMSKEEAKGFAGVREYETVKLASEAYSLPLSHMFSCLVSAQRPWWTACQCFVLWCVDGAAASSYFHYRLVCRFFSCISLILSDPTVQNYKTDFCITKVNEKQQSLTAE